MSKQSIMRMPFLDSLQIHVCVKAHFELKKNDALAYKIDK